MRKTKLEKWLEMPLDFDRDLASFEEDFNDLLDKLAVEPDGVHLNTQNGVAVQARIG